MSDVVKEIFARNLNYFMNKTGITQADICRALKVSSATVSDWCNGKKFPRTDSIQQLADLLGVRFSMLTSESGLQDYEDMQRLEAFHQNSELRTLFDRAMKVDHEDVEFVSQYLERIIALRQKND